MLRSGWRSREVMACSWEWTVSHETPRVNYRKPNKRRKVIRVTPAGYFGMSLCGNCHIGIKSQDAPPSQTTMRQHTPYKRQSPTRGQEGERNEFADVPASERHLG